MAEAANSEVATSKREKVSQRTFKNKEGEYTSRVGTDSLGFKVELLGSGAVIEKQLKDFDPGIINAAALFGLVTSITNTFGGISDPDEMAEAMDARLETLLAGEWSAERQTGPRTSDLLEAYVAFRSKNGKDTDDAKRESFLNDLKSGAAKAKDLLNDNPGLAAEFAAIKARRAAERAAKAAEAAGEQKASALLD